MSSTTASETIANLPQHMPVVAQDEFLSRDRLRAGLKTKAVKGAAIRIVSNGTAACLTLASTVILARLLSPEQFGLFGMVVVITEFARSFIELGLGTVTVQKNDLTTKEVSALFWINLATGIVFMATMAGLAPTVVWFYGDARLLRVCLVLSIVFVWNALAIQHRSLLERQMQFWQMGATNVSATFVATIVAVALALRGYGVWALVWREIVNAAVYAGGTWLCCGWRPSRPRFDVDLRSSLRFGAHLSGYSVIQYLALSMDRVLIGRFFGPTAVGLYTRAAHLATMPIDHIRMTVLGVGLAPLSALTGDPERYRRFYANLLSALSFVYMPVAVFIAVECRSIVLLVLGERWEMAVPLLRVLAIAAVASPILSTFQLVLVSSGKSRRYLNWGALNAASLIAAYLIGVRWGPRGVAYAYAAASYGMVLWSLRYCLHGTPVTISDVMHSVTLPLLTSVTAGMIRLGLGPAPFGVGGRWTALVSAAILSTAYIGIWLCLPAGRKRLSTYAYYSRELIRPTDMGAV